MYIDTVSIRSRLPPDYNDIIDFNDKFSLTRRLFPKLQYYDRSLKVTKQQGASTNTIYFEFKTKNCVHNLPSFTLIDSYPRSNAQLRKLTSSNPPVTGTFNLQWNGEILTSKTFTFE